MSKFSLLETIADQLSLFTTFVILKVKKDVNRVEIFNQIRALEGVVVIEPLNSDTVAKLETELYDYSLIKLKYIAYGSPLDDISRIKKAALSSAQIDGLQGFHIQQKSIKQVEMT